ncbi:hypothetical protein AYI68_g2615 [Smittium mucronatum]|uniref:YCII-related domain-containing protein n=1 Tax=Smittium mucronatum TaxID=133383 RepID=A0A1R0GRT8_9FUNG|nr:hypothetical protein AYI68_g6322 [Smittium mucronatum]OLY83245.1 hypothetical protein AYI68_g2615 [Smittium mucronatum]
MDQRKFLAYVQDFTDEDCVNRRLSARGQHITNNSVLKNEGKSLIMGGALTDKNETMRGSALVYYAKDRVEVLELMEKDIYVKARVWNMATAAVFDITNEFSLAN